MIHGVVESPDLCQGFYVTKQGLLGALLPMELKKKTKCSDARPICSAKLHSPALHVHQQRHQSILKMIANLPKSSSPDCGEAAADAVLALFLTPLPPQVMTTSIPPPTRRRARCSTDPPYPHTLSVWNRNDCTRVPRDRSTWISRIGQRIKRQWPSGSTFIGKTRASRRFHPMRRRTYRPWRT